MIHPWLEPWAEFSVIFFIGLIAIGFIGILVGTLDNISDDREAVTEACQQVYGQEASFCYPLDRDGAGYPSCLVEKETRYAGNFTITNPHCVPLPLAESEVIA